MCTLQRRKFQITKEIRVFLSSLEVEEKPDFEIVEVGYIEPCHNMKGKKQWIHPSDDIKAMYEETPRTVVKYFIFSLF